MEKPTIDSVLAMFKNGEQRFETDSVFKEVCDSLVAGLGVYSVLDSVLKRYKSTRDKLAEALSENQTLKDELASYKEALQHYQK